MKTQLFLYVLCRLFLVSAQLQEISVLIYPISFYKHESSTDIGTKPEIVENRTLIVDVFRNHSVEMKSPYQINIFNKNT